MDLELHDRIEAALRRTVLLTEHKSSVLKWQLGVFSDVFYRTLLTFERKKEIQEKLGCAGEDVLCIDRMPFVCSACLLS